MAKSILIDGPSIIAQQAFGIIKNRQDVSISLQDGKKQLGFTLLCSKVDEYPKQLVSILVAKDR